MVKAQESLPNPPMLFKPPQPLICLYPSGQDRPHSWSHSQGRGGEWIFLTIATTFPMLATYLGVFRGLTSMWWPCPHSIQYPEHIIFRGCLVPYPINATQCISPLPIGWIFRLFPFIAAVINILQHPCPWILVHISGWFSQDKVLEVEFLIKGTQNFKAVDRALMAERFVQTPSWKDYTQTGHCKWKLTYKLNSLL